MNDDGLLLRVDEAASRLQIRRSKLYQLLQSGELGSIRLGRARRIPTRLLEEYIERLITEQVEERLQ